jgi:hypothetical protein
MGIFPAEWSMGIFDLQKKTGLQILKFRPCGLKITNGREDDFC